MNNPFKKTKEPTELDDIIGRLHKAIINANPETEGYAHMVDQYTKLKKIQAETSQKPISREALFAAGVNLTGILMIISFERTHALTSKALGFIFKTKNSS
jgi:hypothetical protein